ncbi:MAG: nicotinate (nicotinamide) nucleotide adenylyltransferase [Mucinivorans sp.]
MVAKHIALLLGSFNPPHVGHTAIARWAVGSGAADEVWVVPTPHNPLKQASELAPWDDRLAMVRLAFERIAKVEICEVENSLPEPHYTINTIEHLKNIYPDVRFSILCGADIERELPLWHRIDDLRRMVDFVVYPRGQALGDLPLYDHNSTEIRRGNGSQWLDPAVQSYIREHKLYFYSPLLAAQKAWGAGQFGEVINLATQNPAMVEIEKMALMAREILDFRCTDIYNP